ncbi:MAG: non-canonical purine NTP pyrophosphatase [Planctomycetota bacterium]
MQTDLSRPVVLATANPKKVGELRAIFAELGLAIESLAEIHTGTTEPEETGTTFEQNATIKAVGYARQTGRVCLADDSGLEVDALAGAPGVISSHYCTDGAETGMSRAERDAANNTKLMQKLGDRAPSERTARFVCVMVLASPDGTVHATAQGTFEGAIGLPEDVPRGGGGFGYDPLFLVAPELVHTSAELGSTDKNRLSHRGKAARSMAEAIAAMRSE